MSRPVAQAVVAAEVFVPPTPEMRRWAARLNWALAPGSAAGTALVTPIAHVASSSIAFQTYLYAIFHRTLLARVGHTVCMPLIVAALFGTMFVLHPALGVAATAAIGAWYIALGHANGMPALATLGGFVALALGGLGAWWAMAASVWWTHPLTAVVMLGLAQAISHSLEDVPPRVNGTDSWMPVLKFFRQTPLWSSARAAAMLPAGAMNEIWGSWRLLPILLLDGMWRGGYQRAKSEAHAALVARACDGGNPAIDYIGTGGTAHSPYAAQTPAAHS